MYEMEIPIIIDKDLVTYEYDPFARDFHVYMDIWNPVIGEILKCKREPTNEVDKHAVEIMCSDSLGKESVVDTFLTIFRNFHPCSSQSRPLQSK